MKRYTSATTSQPRQRGGFTLIELLITISIIAVLIGLLVPALSSVRRGVKVTEVKTEISQLDAAVAEFESELSADMPSQITLYEAASGWASDSRSRALIKGIWPKFDFSIDRRLNDDNGDGLVNSSDSADDIFTLKGDQCLVFFLGGRFSGSQGFIGFSSNPRDPFDTNSTSGRVGPFFNFVPQRIGVNEDSNLDGTLDPGEDVNGDGVLTSDIPGATYNYSNNGTVEGDCTRWFPVYLDDIGGQTRPYLFASSYGGQGYQDDTVNASYTGSDVETPASPGFRIYRTGSAAWEPKGFQIISPGFDGEYGTGGVFNPEGNPKLPGGAARNAEKDNLVNFNKGPLDE